jgi:cytochrome c biogenesis protein CcmG/thiol:disulfide interchange protein DsbE
MRRALVVLVVVLAACTSSPPAASGPAVEELGGAAPALSGRTLSGDVLSAVDYRGRPVIVNFWATWCMPCKRELPLLSAAHAEQGDDGAFFVGVDYMDDAGAARKYLADLGVGYPSIADADGELARRFGVPFLPTTVVIDADGRLRYRVTGEIDAATLDRLLADVSPR